jgi:hypothetical protein
MDLHFIDLYVNCIPPFDTNGQRDPELDWFCQDVINRVAEIQSGGQPDVRDPAALQAYQYLGFYEKVRL